MTDNNSTPKSTSDAPAAADPGASTKPSNPYSLWLLERLINSTRGKTLRDFPVAAVFLAFAIGAPITLVGLPLGAMKIVHHYGCCTNQSIADLISFWGSAFGGMLALFGILITAVFVISAFRIDKSARAEAVAAAAESVAEFIVKQRAQLLELIDQWLGVVKTKRDEAIAAMDAEIETVVSVGNQAVRRIEAASKEAVAQMAQVRDDVAGSGQQTKETMDQAASDVADQKTTAIERIGAELAEVERVAAEARDRIERQQPDQPPPSDSQD